MGKRFTALNGMALVVGVLAGLAAVFFRELISLVQNLAFEGRWAATAREEGAHIVSAWGPWVILVPFAGGLAIALLRRFWPGLRQHGITEVMAAVQAKGGILKGRSSWGHALVAALTTGTGGSTGREGPIGYIGAALGSSLGRRTGLGARDIKILLGCGFAAGIGASFNAPLGGVFMAVELVVPEFSTHAFIPLVLATVVGVVVAGLFLGSDATFDVPSFSLNSPWELLAYLALGLVCGLVAVAFIRLIAWSNAAWARLAIPEVAKPPIGGLFVGILGLLVWVFVGQYHVFGTGYASIAQLLGADASGFAALLPLLLLLAVAKPVATAVTVGSGGGGGMFSVSLFQGAVLGGLVGLGAMWLAPGISPNPAAYAIVGMGAFYAASTRATVTAIVILAELTQDYAVLLPAMLAAVTADAVSVRLSQVSLYTIKLRATGIRYEHDRVQDPLDSLLVKDAMSAKVETLVNTVTVGEAFNQMMDGGHTGYPVVDPAGKLAGMVTRRDLAKHLHAGRGKDPLASVVAGLCITAFPNEVLFRARDRLYQQDIGRLVVVDPDDRTKVVGILTRSDLLRAEAKSDQSHEDDFSP